MTLNRYAYLQGDMDGIRLGVLSMHKYGRTIRKIKRFIWHFFQLKWADNHGILLPVKHPLVSSGIAHKVYLGDYESKEIDIISNRLSADDVVLDVVFFFQRPA